MTKGSRNERNTEDIVRRKFDSDPDPDLIVEAQSPRSADLKRLLRGASKHGGGVGKPEFLVSTPSHPKLLVVVECKADPRHHESPDRDNPAGFAVDGVLHYANALSKGRDVVAVAVSGETEDELRVSTFKQTRGAPFAVPLEDEHGLVEEIRPFSEYARLVTFDPHVRQREQKALLDASKDLHQFLYSKVGCTEEQKPLLVSACLIALRDDTFARTYSDITAQRLPKTLLDTVEAVLRDAELPEQKRTAMMQPYRFIEVHPELGKNLEGESTGALHHILDQIERDVIPYVTTYEDIDVLGHFYGEFLRYTAGDGKGLGIVLTPRHITELFAEIADVGPSSTVLDPCAGTAGFLISSMVRMLAAAGRDESAQARIRSEGLVGIEKQPHMFALAASNMLLRGDGKANLYLGSSLDSEIREKVGSDASHRRPTVGMINPPYAMKQAGQSELDFIKAMLDMLEPGSIGLAIVPMSVGIRPNPVKQQILNGHTLIAAMSMPTELFYPVGTVTCILVFRAGRKHDSERETWFGYWKEDGFTKTKDRGRIDLDDQWQDIRAGWLDGYRNKREVPGRSVLAKVSAEDEWCAEAYLETDYSTLTESDFEAELKKYALYLLSSGITLPSLGGTND